MVCCDVDKMLVSTDNYPMICTLQRYGNTICKDTERTDVDEGIEPTTTVCHFRRAAIPDKQLA